MTAYQLKLCICDILQKSLENGYLQVQSMLYFFMSENETNLVEPGSKIIKIPWLIDFLHFMTFPFSFSFPGFPISVEIQHIYDTEMAAILKSK